VRDSERVDDEGEWGAVTFDVKRVNEGTGNCEMDEDGFEGEVVGRGCCVAWLVGCADLTTRSPFACTCD
jgi:hypothetical protein